MGLPRMRGDRPCFIYPAYDIAVFTPHARGSTFDPLVNVPGVFVYPACAGIDPAGRAGQEAPGSLPRMRGDRPTAYTMAAAVGWFTPHARGSTFIDIVAWRKLAVYPACAGIDRPFLRW